MGFGSRNLRSILPLLLGVALFAMGLLALHHLLRPVNPADIIAQVRATSVAVLAASLAATAIGYAALVFYDWFALRYVGRKLGGSVVALGGFLGYAFGNTIGISVVSGGAVRYRVYSAVGLNAFEVAAVSGYVAVAYGVGVTLVGLVALAVHPGAVSAYSPYSEATVRSVAGCAALLIAAVIVWVSAGRRRFRFRGLELRLPPLPDIGGQLFVTMIDLAAASFALWVLLPAGKPDFITFVAVYAVATMVGVLSHVPGGVGVFETVVIGTLPASVPVGDAAASLLLFRMIYYLVPFALGFLLVGLNEARAASGVANRLLARLPSSMQPAMATLHGLSPSLVAVVALGSGAYLLLVTMIPSVRSVAIAEDDLIGVLLLEGGTLATSVAGIALLIISHGLARRVSSAYWFALLALALGATAALLNDVDLENALLLTIVAVTLAPFRKAFDRPGRLTQGVFEARWFALVFAVGLATAALFFFVHKSVPYSDSLWSEFSSQSNTPRALRAGLAASALLFFFGLYLLTRPSRRRPGGEADAGALARAAGLVSISEDPHAWLSQTGDMRFLFSDEGNAFLMYGIHGGSWVALGDPVGEPTEFQALCWSFCELASKTDCRPVFYEVGPRNLQMWVELGLTVNKIGEEAVVKLTDFGLAGGRFKTMRAALNKREREGYRVEILHPPHGAELIARLREISNAWLKGKTGREKGFSVGHFDARYLGLFDIAVVRKAGQIIAFANILATSGGRFVAIDLMRYLPDQASGLMEYMFLRLMETYRDRGAEEFSLGTAPLAGLSDRSVTRSWNRFGRLVYQHGGAFYNFEGLRAFKQKFRPEWRPRYMVLPANASPLVAIGDVALLTAGTARGMLTK